VLTTGRLKFAEIVRALRCGTAWAGGQPVWGVSPLPLLFAGLLVEVSRQEWRKKARITPLTTGSYSPGVSVDRVIVGSAPAVIPGGRKHPGRLTTLIRSRGGSRQALGAGSPGQGSPDPARV
jgi:hypothetical protein